MRFPTRGAGAPGDGSLSLLWRQTPRGSQRVLGDGTQQPSVVASVRKHLVGPCPPKLPSLQGPHLPPEMTSANKLHPALLSGGESRLRQEPTLGLHLPPVPTLLLCPPLSPVPADGAHRPVRKPTFEKATAPQDLEDCRPKVLGSNVKIPHLTA